jgi:hypothetical protein
MPRFLYVIARDRRDLYERLKSEFSRQEDVGVVLDRRREDRRRAPSADTSSQERRRSDRRKQRDLQDELRANGSFLTSCADVVLVVVR